MAGVCGFGQIPDLRCKSLCCYGRVILDRNCNLFVANANIDKVLTVGIGGNVNFPATTINFKHSTVDFTGATITGFTGNISGDLTLGDLLVTGNISSKNIYTSTLTSNIITTNLLVGSVMGDLMGNISVYNITAKSGTISIIGNLETNIVGQLTGDSIGTHTGPIITNSITEQTPGADIIVTGNLVGYHVGSMCIATDGVLLTNTIEEKTPGAGITMTGNVFIGKLTVESFVGVFGGTFEGSIITDSITPPAPGIAAIFIGGSGGINVPGPIVTTQITVSGAPGTIDTQDLIVQGSMTVDNIAPLGPLLTLDGDVKMTENVLIEKDLTVDGFVCTPEIRVHIIKEKIQGQGIVLNGNLIAGNITVNDITILSDLTIKGNINTNLANLIAANFIGNLIGSVCGNVHTYHITEKRPGTGIKINGETTVSENLNCEANINVIGVIHGNVSGALCGNINVWEIRSKRNDGNIDVYGNVILHSRFIGDIVSSDMRTSTLHLNSASLYSVLFIGDASGEVKDDSGFTYNPITNILDLPMGGGYAINGITILPDNLGQGSVLFGGTFGEISDSVNLTYNSGNATLSVPNVYTSNITMTSLSNTLIPYSSGGTLTGQSGFNIVGTNVNVPSLVAATSITSGSLSILDGLIIAGTAGLLSQNASLTFSASVLNTPSLTTTTTIKNTSFTTPGWMLYTAAGGVITGSSGITFDSMTDELTIASLANGSISNVVFADINGKLTVDTVNNFFLYDEGTATLSVVNLSCLSSIFTSSISVNTIPDGSVVVAGVSGALTSTAGFYLTGFGQLAIPSLVQSYITYGGSGGLLQTSASFTFDDTFDRLSIGALGSIHIGTNQIVTARQPTVVDNALTLTDNTGGATDQILDAITSSFTPTDATNLNNNFADLAQQVNYLKSAVDAIINRLQTHGLIA